MMVRFFGPAAIINKQSTFAIIQISLAIGFAIAIQPMKANAQSAKGKISLTWSSGISATAASMPRLQDSDSIAARRINTELTAADHRLRAAIAQCKTDARDEGATGWDWARTVTVAMAGPSYLSFVISDNAFCGGAYPNFETFALTFDLTSGRPVDWANLLPPPLVEATATEDAMDNTELGLARSKLLVKLGADPSADCNIDENAEFQLWPDVVKKGLEFAWTDAPHANESCGDPVLLPLGTLRQYGASAKLIEALTYANKIPNRQKR